MFTEVLASNKSLFAVFNPAANRMDTLLHEQMSQENSDTRRSGNFVASYLLCGEGLFSKPVD